MKISKTVTTLVMVVIMAMLTGCGASTPTKGWESTSVDGRTRVSIAAGKVNGQTITAVTVRGPETAMTSAGPKTYMKETTKMVVGSDPDVDIAKSVLPGVATAATNGVFGLAIANQSKCSGDSCGGTKIFVEGGQALAQSNSQSDNAQTTTVDTGCPECSLMR